LTLTVEHLKAGYGESVILSDLSFEVGDGEIVTILGRNGSGRSTTCKAILGLLPKTGRVLLDGTDITRLASHNIARAGIGYVPEEREIFKKLTVEENLVLGQKPGRRGYKSWSIEELYDLFPRLRERRNVAAGNLSGGEQQMLTMFRAMVGNPGLLLVDEPTEGLAPMIVEQVQKTLLELKRRGTSILLLEQKLAMALKIADRVLVMGHGQIAFAGTVEDFERDRDVRRRWLEVA
jgi:branched-chain amino acid transport system ATP-binding protein